MMSQLPCTCGISDPKTFGHRHDCAAVDEKKQLRARVQNAEAAAIRLLMEHDSARVAEAELARQRPVVDAAEALVEHWDGSARGIEYYDVREQLEDALAEKVREAQR